MHRTYQYSCENGFYDASGNNGTMNELKCIYSSTAKTYELQSVDFALQCSGTPSCVLTAQFHGVR